MLDPEYVSTDASLGNKLDVQYYSGGEEFQFNCYPKDESDQWSKLKISEFINEEV